MKRTATILVSASTLWLAFVPNAAAHTVKWRSKPSISHVERAGTNIVRIEGRVYSSKPACLSDRYVEVFAGNQVYGADPQTDADGQWEINGVATYGVPLRVRVLRRSLDDTEAHNHICLGASKRYSRH